MSRDTNTQLTISIWRDLEPKRPLSLSSDGENSQLLDSYSGLQEQVYSWPLREDAFAGISDDAIRRDLHERLVEKLADRKPPSERRLEVLREFVEASQAVMDAGGVSWTHCESRYNEIFEGEAHDQIEINSLLSLVLHLRWVINCFGDRPGMSVSVR